MGSHTGSRLAEFGQSKKPKGALYATVPNNKAAGRWAGQALAFIIDDFEFYSATGVKMTISQVLMNPQDAVELHV